MYCLYINNKMLSVHRNNTFRLRDISGSWWGSEIKKLYSRQLVLFIFKNTEANITDFTIKQN